MPKPTMVAGQLEILDTARGFRCTYTLARKCILESDGALGVRFFVIAQYDTSGSARVAPFLSEPPAREHFAAFTTPIRNEPPQVDKSPKR